MKSKEPPSTLKADEAHLFLSSLKEDGIEEIYIEPKDQGAPPTQTVQTSGGGELREKMIALRAETLKCTLCSELASTRTNVVFGSGNIKADLMFVGEAPGRDEDQQGLPFVGRAGKLLTKIIESIGLSRSQVFIANTLKCRPPKNRPPLPEEVTNCNSYLMKQIEMIRPKIICALGKFAGQTLLESDVPISKLRGEFHDYHYGSKLMCTYHPAYLLRNPAEKRTVWGDMKKIRDELKRLKRP